MEQCLIAIEVEELGVEGNLRDCYCFFLGSAAAFNDLKPISVGNCLARGDHCSTASELGKGIMSWLPHYCDPLLPAGGHSDKERAALPGLW